MRVRGILQAAVVIALVSPSAHGHICGNQDHDNRPNHCEVKKEADGEEVWVHQVSSCKVVEPGKCQYNHCAGSTQIIEDADCCCLESTECPGATYVGICLGTSGKEKLERAEATAAKEWVITKAATSNACHVQKATASPFGDVVSRHDTRKEACQHALDLHDESMTDKGKCFTYGGGTVTACKSEGVELPK